MGETLGHQGEIVSTFLSADDVAHLTGRKTSAKQIEALRTMQIPFWVNGVGKPVVSIAAVEGRKENRPVTESVLPKERRGRRNTRNLNMPPYMHPRVQRSGKVYYYMYTRDKPRKEIALGDDLILALKKYAQTYTIAVPMSEALFRPVEQRYLVDSLPKLAASSARTYQSDIKHLLEVFCDMPLSKIRPMHIRQFLDRHSDKPTTANRCKRLFSTMWNQARGWGYTDLPNPCEGIKGHSLNKRADGVHYRCRLQRRVRMRQRASTGCDGSGLPDRPAPRRRATHDRARHHRRASDAHPGEDKAAASDRHHWPTGGTGQANRSAQGYAQ